MRPRQEYRVFPIDTNKNIAVGIKIPFNGKGIFGLNYTTQDQVKTNLTNFMLTNPGERLYNVDYGAGLRDLLFEPQGNTDEIRSRITDRISAYFPQITLLSLDFKSDNDRGFLYITLKYSFNRVDDTLLIGLQL
jgi:phage baseplate assembly protein W